MQIDLSPEVASVLSALLSDSYAVDRAKVNAEKFDTDRTEGSIVGRLEDLARAIKARAMYSRHERQAAELSRMRGRLRYSRIAARNGGQVGLVEQMHVACSETEMRLAVAAAKKHGVTFEDALAVLRSA